MQISCRSEGKECPSHEYRCKCHDVRWNGVNRMTTRPLGREWRQVVWKESNYFSWTFEPRMFHKVASPTAEASPREKLLQVSVFPNLNSLAWYSVWVPLIIAGNMIRNSFRPDPRGSLSLSCSFPHTKASYRKSWFPYLYYSLVVLPLGRPRPESPLIWLNRIWYRITIPKALSLRGVILRREHDRIWIYKERFYFKIEF